MTRRGADGTNKQASAAQAFCFSGGTVRIVPVGGGHINSTYRVDCDSGDAYILQAVNGYVFRDPPRVVENIRRVTEYIRRTIVTEGGDPERECLRLIETTAGGYAHIDGAGGCWRAFAFIGGTVCQERAEPPALLRHAGCAFGRFQRQLAGFPVGALYQTIPGFHDTGWRYALLERVAAADPMGRAAEAEPELDFLRRRRKDMPVLTEMQAQGALPTRVVHNDTKLSNVLLDAASGLPVCVIDLDTVMPGILPHDFGDGVRSGVNPAPEDERDLSKVVCDLTRFRLFAKGFLDGCGAGITDAEWAWLVFSVRMMTLECGMRFLTDHLDGDRYFRVDRPGQNLDRARCQLRLAADIEDKFDAMEVIVADLRRRIRP